MPWRDVPIFITTRDRLSDLILLVSWLEIAGHTRITFVDNDSQWPPLLEFLDDVPYRVVRSKENLGSQAAWKLGLIPDDEGFVVTDPDVVPCASCPPDAVERLSWAMHRHNYPKAGLGLKITDVPPDMPSLEWERELVSPDRELEPGVFESLVDTTFALYRPGVDFLLESLRLGAPYQARHMPWYRDGALDAEHEFYLSRAMRGPEGTTWRGDA